MARTDIDEEVVAALSIALPRVDGVHVLRDAPLARLTALRVGGPADLLVFVETPEALLEVSKLMKRVKCPWRVQWPFDPHLPKDGGFAGAVIVLGRSFDGLHQGPDDTVILGAATPFAALSAAGAGFAHLAAWPGTPGGLLAGGGASRLAGPCAAVTAVTSAAIRRRTVAATEAPPTPSRTTVPISIELRPVPPAHPPPLTPGHLLEPDGALADIGCTAMEVARAMSDAGLAESRLRGWTVSREWPGVVMQSGEGTTRDLDLFARALSEKLHRERGMLTRQVPRIWGRSPLSVPSRSRK